MILLFSLLQQSAGWIFAPIAEPSGLTIAKTSTPDAWTTSPRATPSALNFIKTELPDLLTFSSEDAPSPWPLGA